MMSYEEITLKSKKKMRSVYNKPKNSKKRETKKRKPWSMFNGLRRINKSCRRKKTFKTRDEARYFAVQYGQYVYQCSGCGKFHLSTPKRL